MFLSLNKTVIIVHMAKVELKTKKTKASVATFLNTISSPLRKAEAKQVLEIMKEVTKAKPKMWGTGIVGFGDYHYTYKTGREGDFFIIGFHPRKDSITIYIMPGYHDFDDLLKKLGPHKMGKGCLYLKKLDDLHIPTLKKIIARGWKDMKTKHPDWIR
jgi:nucleoid DNA-binding protein